MFVAISATSTLVKLCFALYTDTSLTCASFVPNSAILTWGTAGTPRIKIGDTYNTSIIGKIVDARYYPTGLPESDFLTQFTRRKVICIPNCQTCSDLVVCTLCASGWFLQVGNTCVRCNACCATCTGASESQCTSCNPLCVSTGPTTCKSNF